jgi:ribosome-associated protein
MDLEREKEIRDAVRSRGAFSASRSSGPGGQHVNTSATRVELRVPLSELPLSGAELARVRGKLGGRITAGDELRVAIGSERSQLLNRQRAEDLLVQLVVDASRAERPRRPTRPTRASVERRRADKERRSQLKSGRSRRVEPD